MAALLVGLGLGASGVQAKGGTAKPTTTPPPGLPTGQPDGTANGTPAVLVPRPPAMGPGASTFTTPALNIHGFDVTGFIQAYTVDGSRCPGLLPAHDGGTVTVNGLTITIPCNTVLQMPAATYNWAELFDPALASNASNALTLSSTGTPFPSTEITITGNIVGDEYIAGLVYISQQSLNGSSGYIRRIDYSDGSIYVSASPGGAERVRLLINDPNGRFGRAQSPDPRFSVDDENPTIKSAGSGYPMCVPRTLTDPTAAGAKVDDPLCPQKNRPRLNLLQVNNGCRNFRAAGVVSPAGWELSAVATPGQVYCSAFVMKAPPTTPVTATLPAANVATATEPDARQQAPFEVGDFILYAGTLLKGDAKGPNGSDTISVHTIDANVGIYTQPGTLPVYMSIGEFGVGADAPAQAANLVPQEAQDRIFLEASVSDVTSVLDIYLVDKDPATGAESNRWITPESMTGGVTPGTLPYGGGITTQLIGPQPGRARIRMAKATPGILVSPTRNVRITVRSLCAPSTYKDPLTGVQYYGINDTTPALIPTALQVKGGATTSASCLDRAVAANGLSTGQYAAPNFGFIFPENVVSGDPAVPYNFWDLGFLVNGEDNVRGTGPGPLTPKPW
ncbi:MAG: hypothetical protein AB9M60_03165 [Leptothrix sp. (in: b-proteobacteria)]